MSIGTILLIGGAVAIMFFMHRVGHAGHAGAHNAHGSDDSATAASDGHIPGGAETPAAGPGVDGHMGHGDHVGDGVNDHADAGRREEKRKHGCC